MQQNIYLGWVLVIPAGLALIYGSISIRAISALGYVLKPAFSQQFKSTLSVLLLFLLWCVIPMPLALFYILLFVSRMAGRIKRKKGRLRELFLINLVYILSISVHMILIGAASMACHTTMNELLLQPYWRIATLSAAALSNILVDGYILRHGMALTVLRTQADSEEVRPFIMFMWFCNVFLLLDSILCSLRIGWELLPLFLVCSTLLLEFYLYRFLNHIYSILKVHYLEDENQRLTEELERQERIEAELRKKGERDAMTGTYSRRYVLDRMDGLLREKRRFSLVYIDLDKLKTINDREGHQAGDRFLIRFVEFLEHSLRKNDILGRIGGDEFIILLPDCGGDSAKERMERTREEAERETCCGHSISFSFGVAEAAESCDADADRLMRQADQAMYLDKKRKNRQEVVT